MAIGRFRAALNFKDLTDTSRHTTLGSIEKLAPASTVYSNNPSLQASLASLVKKDAALSTSNTTVENDKKQLKADTANETVARAAYDAELHNFATLAGNAATSAADLAGLGLTPLVPAPRPKGPPPVPAGIDIRYPARGHGKATIAVQAPKGAAWDYMIQVSPNPPTATSYEMVPGNGKTRVLTGASGTQLWVKAARIRGGVQSDFCTAVLVTIP